MNFQPKERSQGVSHEVTKARVAMAEFERILAGEVVKKIQQIDIQGLGKRLVEEKLTAANIQNEPPYLLGLALSFFKALSGNQLQLKIGHPDDQEAKINLWFEGDQDADSIGIFIDLTPDEETGSPRVQFSLPHSLSAPYVTEKYQGLKQRLDNCSPLDRLTIATHFVNALL